MKDIKGQVLSAARKLRDYSAETLSSMVKIPSFSGKEEAVCRRIESMCREAGFDEVRIDGLGNVIGRVGHGPRKLAIDAHIDTVGVGDRTRWETDPFSGIIRDGLVLGRGTADQKGGAAAMIGAGRILHELGYDGQFSVYFTFTVLEEDCDGLCWLYLIEKEGLVPEYAVSTEPTSCRLVPRPPGQDGDRSLRPRNLCARERPRARRERRVQGRARGAGHGQAERDPLLRRVPRKGHHRGLEDRGPRPEPVRRSRPGEHLHGPPPHLGGDGGERPGAGAPLHGQGRGEGRNAVVRRQGMERRELRAGPVLPDVEDPRGSSAGGGGRAAYSALFGRQPEVGKWTFSTNCVAICGKHGIPSVGFGPGDEDKAHAPNEHTRIDDLVTCSAFYAMLPLALCVIPIGDDNSGRRTTPWVTWALVAVNVAVFVFFEGFGTNQRFINAYSTVPQEILSGRDIVTRDRAVLDPDTGSRLLVPGLQPTPVPVWLTILISMFMHAGIAHIAGNMLYLFIFGDNIEDRLGHFRYLLFYVFCGAAASLSQVYVTKLTGGNLLVPSLGASGAIAGVLGAYLLLFPRNRVRVLMFRFITTVPAIFAVGIWFVFQVIAELGVLGRDTCRRRGVCRAYRRLRRGICDREAVGARGRLPGERRIGSYR